MAGAAVENGGEDKRAAEGGMNADESPYSEGDRVMIPLHSLIYEAKIEKSAFDSKNGWKYFVHYMGWNKKYDEWMPYASLKKFDDSVKLTKPRQQGAQQKKRKREVSDEDFENMCKVSLPTLMKNKLVEEWDAITRDGKLIDLPKTKEATVGQILAQFEELVESREPWPEICSGLKGYFNKTLKTMLLYPQEREQADKLLKGKTLPSDVYGAEHLVRLFLKLPAILPYTNLNEESLVALVARLQSIVTFIKEQAATLYDEL
mmetsp:Transcript_14794/g.30766  ORF Transcript_14794/g.30766 Transcript_14794/m.30766 type:complete len:261 (+) Transcript_14794:61-843(+)